MFRRERDAQAGAGADHLSGMFAGLAQRLEQGLGLEASAGDIERLLREHDEFVATEAGDHVGRAERAGEPRRRLEKQFVAGIVAKRIVDRFEVVEIDQEQADRAACLGHDIERLLQTLLEEQAVRQAGQVVMRRLPPGAGLSRLAIGDVDDARDTASAPSIGTPVAVIRTSRRAPAPSRICAS